MTDRVRATDRLDVRGRLTAITPIPVMRSTRVDTLDEAIDGIAAASVEWRLGGAPIQVHRDDGDVVIFDRAGVDVTEQLDGVVDVVRALPDGDIVLEGNIVRFAADGLPVDASGVSLDEMGGSHADVGACFVDLLAASGQLVAAPLATRLQMLDDLVPPANLVPRAEVGDIAGAERCFDDAVRRGHPGVVVKDLTSPYAPGQRSHSWRHVVPVHILELIVIGAQPASTQRADRFSTLLLGAPTSDGDVVMVGTSSSGVTAEMLDWQTKRFEALAIDDDNDDDGSDVLYLRPEQLVEVAVAEVVESSNHPSGVSLRAAKVRRYLSAPADVADSVESIRALAGAPVGAGPDVPTLPDRPRRVEPDRAIATDQVADDHRSSPADDALTVPAQPVLRLPAWVVPDSSSSAAPRTAPLLPPSLQEQVTRRRAPVTDRDFDFPPFEAPKLLSLRFASVLVMVTRALALAWIVLLGVTALDAEPTPVGGASVDHVRMVGIYGIGVVAAICVAGWWWSDRRTRNVHRLDGRRPGRFRCLAAWSAPVVLPALVGITVLQLDASEPFDVRPSIAVAVLAFALSRPILLIRRILATLIRVRFDGLMGAAFVLDLTAFGLIAWRLAVWPSPGEALSAAEIDTLVVVCAATMVVLLLALVDWALVLRTAASTEAHRATSQRTRYEHRMLRLRNVDPTDPAVWWALVSRRASEQRDLGATERGAGRHDSTFVIPSADEFVEQARRRHRRALTRLGPSRSEVLLDQLRTEFLSVTEEVRAAAANALGDVRSPIAGSVRGEPADESLSTETLSTFRWRLGSVWEEIEQAPAGALEQLLDHAGSLHIEATLAEHRRDDEETGRERTVPPKLYTLESARVLLLAALIATVAAAVWLVSLTVGAGLLADNESLSAEGLARIERARLAVTQAFSVTLLGATLWSWATAVYARRCRPPSSPTRRTLVCFLVASAACAAMFLVDAADEGVTALLVLVPATACAVVSVVSLEPVARWFRLRTGPLVMWVAGLPMILILERIGRLHDDIDRQATLQSQTFLAILIGLTSALVGVVAASSTMEVEDGIRLAPELAVPADRARGSGGGTRRRTGVPVRR